VIDYFMTPVSPWTYLGGERFEALAKRHGATINYKPCDFANVMSVSGGVPVAQRPKQRQAYRLHELERWRDFLGIKLNLQPKFFPAPPQLAATTIIAARQQGADAGKLANALLRACWAEDRNIADPETVKAVCRESGLDGEKLVAAAGGAEAQREFQANTEEAIERQVFGAPWYVYKGKPYWGQDRLDFLDRALAAG
jgi:2-hydroxychromene-2-carboxylate isomerase